MLPAAVYFVVTMIALIAVLRVVVMVLDRPALRARLWPWFRSRPWWPVPAERTAEALLRHMLPEHEYRGLCYNGYLDVPSPSIDGRTYRVPRGPGQVLVVESGQVMERLCLQPAAGGLPEADVVLMHKLLIESDERNYLLTANHFPRSIWY